MALHQILNPVVLRDLARSWIREDLSSFDLQGLAAGDKEIVATIYCKSSGVLAGVPFLNAIFDELKCTPNWFYKEGEWLEHSSPINGHGPSPPVEVAYVGGQAKNVLLAERLALNVLARCSGVATKARRVKMAVDDMGWKGTIAGTRKTTPGFRMVEKYGLLVGGVSTHRYDMSGMVMIKDNHVNLCGGSIEKAVNMVKGVASFMQKIEVETRNMEEAQAALRAGADIIMLDNFKLPDLIRTSKWVKEQNSNILIEASGGITEQNLKHYAKSSIDIISLSALVQGYECVDFSMKVLTNTDE